MKMMTIWWIKKMILTKVRQENKTVDLKQFKVEKARWSIVSSKVLIPSQIQQRGGGQKKKMNF